MHVCPLLSVFFLTMNKRSTSKNSAFQKTRKFQLRTVLEAKETHKHHINLDTLLVISLNSFVCKLNLTEMNVVRSQTKDNEFELFHRRSNFPFGNPVKRMWMHCAMTAYSKPVDLFTFF